MQNKNKKWNSEKSESIANYQDVINKTICLLNVNSALKYIVERIEGQMIIVA